jgi:hypothetical protein
LQAAWTRNIEIISLVLLEPGVNRFLSHPKIVLTVQIAIHPPGQRFVGVGRVFNEFSVGRKDLLFVSVTLSFIFPIKHTPKP